MSLCPLEMAFPKLPESVVKPFTSIDRNDPVKFNYVESNTHNFNNTYLKYQEAARLSKQTLTLPPASTPAPRCGGANGPYRTPCMFCNHNIEIDSNIVDILGIATLTFVIYTIISGK